MFYSAHGTIENFTTQPISQPIGTVKAVVPVKMPMPAPAQIPKPVPVPYITIVKKISELSRLIANDHMLADQVIKDFEIAKGSIPAQALAQSQEMIKIIAQAQMSVSSLTKVSTLAKKNIELVAVDASHHSNYLQMDRVFYSLKSFQRVVSNIAQVLGLTNEKAFNRPKARINVLAQKLGFTMGFASELAKQIAIAQLPVAPAGPVKQVAPVNPAPANKEMFELSGVQSALGQMYKSVGSIYAQADMLAQAHVQSQGQAPAQANSHMQAPAHLTEHFTNGQMHLEYYIPVEDRVKYN